MDGTILSQGTFTVGANVVPVNIPVPSGVDWVSVINLTNVVQAGGANAAGIRYFWQLGMANGSAIVEYYANGGAVVTGDYIVPGGISLYDPSGQNPLSPALSAPRATTAMTNATRPVVSAANTTGLVVGSVVRMTLTAQDEVDSVDMVVGAVNPGVSFTLLTASNAMANAQGAIGGAGFYQIVNYPPLFYPRRLVITNITQAALAVVATSVAHGLTVGQQIRFTIPATSGMVQLNGQQATITAIIDDYTFNINIDTTAFTAFTFPTIAQFPATYPVLVPFGMNTGAALTLGGLQVPTIGGVQIYGTQSGILADSTVNTGFLGMTLGTGSDGAINGAAISGPAGTNPGDFILWRVGKSSFGGQ